MYLSYLRNTFKHVLKMQNYQLLDYRTYSDKIKESLSSPPQAPHSIKKNDPSIWPREEKFKKIPITKFKFVMLDFFDIDRQGLCGLPT